MRPPVRPTAAELDFEAGWKQFGEKQKKIVPMRSRALRTCRTNASASPPPNAAWIYEPDTMDKEKGDIRGCLLFVRYSSFVRSLRKSCRRASRQMAKYTSQKRKKRKIGRNSSG